MISEFFFCCKQRGYCDDAVSIVNLDVKENSNSHKRSELNSTYNTAEQDILTFECFKGKRAQTHGAC